MPNTLLETINYTFLELWGEVIAYLPQVVVAILVVIVGWILGGVLMNLVVRGFSVLKINSALNAAGFDKLAERSGHTLDAGTFVGRLVKWFVIIVFFVAALDVLNLDQVTIFLRDIVLGYLPRVIGAVIILLAALVLANIVKTSVTAAARAGEFGSAELLGKVAQYSILVFAVLAALNQLQIAPEFVQMLFAGIVFAASLALGLSFGLGGRDTATNVLKKMSKSDHSSGQF